MTPRLAPYAVLLQAFLEERLAAKEFALLFMTLLKRDRAPLGDLFVPFHAVFASADLFDEDADPKDRFAASDAELRERARAALHAIEGYLSSVDDDDSR